MNPAILSAWFMWALMTPQHGGQWHCEAVELELTMEQHVSSWLLAQHDAYN